MVFICQGYLQSTLPKSWNIGENIVVKMQCVVESKGASGVKPTVNGSVYVQGDLIIVGSCVMDTVISTWFSQGLLTWIIR
jgi:hypothetical protein